MRTEFIIIWNMPFYVLDRDVWITRCTGVFGINITLVTLGLLRGYVWIMQLWIVEVICVTSTHFDPLSLVHHFFCKVGQISDDTSSQHSFVYKQLGAVIPQSTPKYLENLQFFF